MITNMKHITENTMENPAMMPCHMSEWLLALLLFAPDGNPMSAANNNSQAVRRRALIRQQQATPVHPDFQGRTPSEMPTEG